MKILLVLGKYLPHKNGGIENYTHLLSKILSSHYSVEIAILESPESKPYFLDDLRINLLNDSFGSFTELLQIQKFDICHFQEYSAFGGIEMHWISAAKQLCKKVFFTFHLPYFTCYKNDFRYFGVEDCNNFSSAERCVNCVIATRLNYRKSAQFNIINYGIQLLLPLIKRTAKGKSLKGNIDVNTSHMDQLLFNCDNVFLIAKWFQKLLEHNSYDSPKLKCIPSLFSLSTGIPKPLNAIKKKLLFVGRIEPQKGLHLLCKAMRFVSTKDIQLDVYGNLGDKNYFDNCKKKYQFNYGGSVERQELLLKFTDYDFLVLPSVCTEMYPLVLQEAFAAHLPVIVSASQGNVDVVNDGKNGFIFDYDNFEDLASVIDKAYNKKENGWDPQFEKHDSVEENLKEILSYYA